MTAPTPALGSPPTPGREVASASSSQAAGSIAGFTGQRDAAGRGGSSHAQQGGGGEDTLAALVIPVRAGSPEVASGGYVRVLSSLNSAAGASVPAALLGVAA